MPRMQGPVLQRKMMADLIAWKNRPRRKPLLVFGARQVGKTFLVDCFGRQHYQNYFYINLALQPAWQEIFAGDLTADAIIQRIRIKDSNATFDEQTLYFFDEIQVCPAARSALKDLALNAQFDVIASGSQLGINYAADPSLPVGYTERLLMQPLDFEEFLWAMGYDDQQINVLKQAFDSHQAIDRVVHEQYLELFRQFIVVGGMPEVVASFVEEQDYARVFELQQQIVAGYREDIVKYAEGADKAKAQACFNSIPKQLARDSKKFQYSQVEKRGDARKFGGALLWLQDAGIVNFCHCLAALELPLEGNAIPEKFKVYMADTGLLVSMLGYETIEDILAGNLGVYKGAIYENIIAQMLSQRGKKLYYFEKNSKIELDFIIRRAGQPAVVEVKSASNRQSKSMDAAIKTRGIRRGVKLSTANLGLQEISVAQPDGSAEVALVETFPLYMAMFL